MNSSNRGDGRSEWIKQQHGVTPDEALVVGGYMKTDGIINVAKSRIVLYLPVKEVEKKQKKGIDPFAPLPNDAPETAAWRQRMGLPESKEIYVATV